jgi:peptidyl-prolyl cis-trans isomerase C
MKRCISFLVAAAGISSLSWSQSTATAPPAPPAAGGSALKLRGPEVIANETPDKVVATINGKPLTARQAVELLKLLPEAQRKSAPSLQALFERLYMVNDFADHAAKENLDQQSPWKEQLKLDRDNVLAQAYLTKLTAKSSPQTASDPKQYYDTHQDEFDRAKLSGIVIAFNPPGTPASSSGVSRTEQEARTKADDLEKKIAAGADIATLARTESDNQQSAAHGGDLGTLAAGSPNVPPDLKNVVFNKLQVGKISEPIRVPNAFYILKLDSRAKEPFETVRPEILQKIQSEQSQAVIKQEMDKYKIQVQDQDFFASAPATGTAPKVPSLARPASAPTPGAPSTQPNPKH